MKRPRGIQAPAPMPATCWKCSAPALKGRAVCPDCADLLERYGAHLRATAKNRRPKEKEKMPDA